MKQNEEEVVFPLNLRSKDDIKVKSKFLNDEEYTIKKLNELNNIFDIPKCRCLESLIIEMNYNFRKGTEALVIQTFDNRLFVTVEEKVYLLKELAEHKENSKTFDEPVVKITKQQYIPPMTHPWKRKSFEAFLAKQKHRSEYNQNGAYV